MDLSAGVETVTLPTPTTRHASVSIKHFGNVSVADWAKKNINSKDFLRGSVTAAIVNLRGVAPLKNDEKD